jgi:hypothetical protein
MLVEVNTVIAQQVTNSSRITSECASSRCTFKRNLLAMSELGIALLRRPVRRKFGDLCWGEGGFAKHCTVLLLLLLLLLLLQFIYPDLSLYRDMQVSTVQ